MENKEKLNKLIEQIDRIDSKIREKDTGKTVLEKLKENETASQETKEIAANTKVYRNHELDIATKLKEIALDDFSVDCGHELTIVSDICSPNDNTSKKHCIICGARVNAPANTIVYKTPSIGNSEESFKFFKEIKELAMHIFRESYKNNPHLLAEDFREILASELEKIINNEHKSR